jgi:hypothetical protein
MRRAVLVVLAKALFLKGTAGASPNWLWHKSLPAITSSPSTYLQFDHLVV